MMIIANTFLNVNLNDICLTGKIVNMRIMKRFDDIYRYLRPSMLQHLLRRLVFDVPILNEYAKMPLKVFIGFLIVLTRGEFNE